MPTILRLQDFPLSEIQTLLNRYGLTLQIIPIDATIPGSYWQAEEAGIIGLMVYARLDTPLHSIPNCNKIELAVSLVRNPSTT